jgi:hypothetical protein
MPMYLWRASYASGAAHLHSTLLISPEEMDAATKKAVTYTPPGA